jgi:hypothetical protein
MPILAREFCYNKEETKEYLETVVIGTLQHCTILARNFLVVVL